jgi:hypothetical protein
MAIQINLRVSDDLRSKLVAAAEKRGISMNKEINDRLERDFAEEALWGRETENRDLFGLLAIVAGAMTAAGQAAGFFSTNAIEGAKHWFENRVAFDQAIEAAVQVLREACPPEGMKLPEELTDYVAKFGLSFANGLLDEAATGSSRVSGDGGTGRARAKLLREGISDALAKRLQSGVPREPVMLQMAMPSAGSPSVIATLSMTPPESGEIQK